jgi:hypothetical protein
LSDTQLHLAAEETRLAFRGASEGDGHLAGLNWDDLQPLNGFSELCGLLDTSAQIGHTRQVPNLRDACTLDERILWILAHLLPACEMGSPAIAGLPRLLLTWRLCANNMLEVATRDSYTEVLQSLLSESAVRIQTTSPGSLADSSSAALWVVQALRVIPSAPLSRLQVSAQYTA